MLVVQAFQCSYCKKLYTNIEKCIAHEKTCKKNPNGLSCKNCDHLRKRPTNAKFINGGKGALLYCQYGKPSDAAFLTCPHRSITM